MNKNPYSIEMVLKFQSIPNTQTWYGGKKGNNKEYFQCWQIITLAPEAHVVGHFL